MTTTIAYKVNFSKPGRRMAARPPQLPTVATDSGAATTASSPAENAPTRPPCRAARMLALAHLIDRKVEAGEIKSYAEVARALGVSRARMTQIVNLLNLPADVQEDILLGRNRRSERQLRAVLRCPS